VATSLLTTGAILFGYFAKALPGTYTNELDDLFVGKVKALFRKRWSRGDPEKNEKNEKLEEALEKFILTLSDQQLVTGLALLITGFQKCDISVYSFTVVTGLTWFSCTTHLSTLLLLQR